MAKHKVWTAAHKWLDYGFEGKCTLATLSIVLQLGVDEKEAGSWSWDELEIDAEGRQWLEVEPDEEAN